MLMIMMSKKIKTPRPQELKKLRFNHVNFHSIGRRTLVWFVSLINQMVSSFLSSDESVSASTGGSGGVQAKGPATLEALEALALGS